MHVIDMKRGSILERISNILQILSVERMLAKSSDVESTEPQGHPVIRTLYDHGEEVTSLEFHPKEQILVSGSRDFTVRLFDYSRTSVKKAYRVFNVWELSLFLAFFRQ